MITSSTFLSLFKKIESKNLLLISSLIIVVLPHLFRLPIVLTVFCLSIIIWRLLYESGKAANPGKFIRFILMVTGIVIILYSYHSIVGQYAGTALLIVMVCLKLTEYKSSRDATVIIFLGYFIVITTFLFSQSIPVAIYMLLATLFLTTTLIAFQHNSVNQLPHFRLTAHLLVYSIPLAIILFMLFPRLSGPLWGLPSDAFSAKTGISDSMSPGNFSSLSSNNEPAFRVKFDSVVPAPAKRYWRGPVLWSYDGRSWTAPKHERLRKRFFSSLDKSEQVDYTVTLEPHNQHWLFALDIPGSLPKGSKLTPEIQIISRLPVKQVKRYAMTSYLNYQLPSLDYLSPSRYLSLPDSISPKTRKLVEKWKHQSLSDKQLLVTALNYFTENEFFYSRKPPLLFNDPVDEFLFDTRKGYCEHFSSAFTVLMRMSGIPARVVTGYYGGEINPVGDYMIVRQSDAHAWSEVYLTDKGWIRVDPTAVIPPHRIEAEEDIVRIKPQSNQAITILKESSWVVKSFKSITNAVDSINNTWNQWVIGYNNKKQASIFNAFGIPDISWKGLSTLMFILLAGLLVIFSYYIFNNRQQLDPVSKSYLRFCNKMAKAGLIKQDNETAANFARRIIDRMPEKKLSVLKLTSAYNNLHYGKYQSQSLIRTFQQQVNNFRL